MYINEKDTIEERTLCKWVMVYIYIYIRDENEASAQWVANDHRWSHSALSRGYFPSCFQPPSRFSHPYTPPFPQPALPHSSNSPREPRLIIFYTDGYLSLYIRYTPEFQYPFLPQ